MWDIRLEGKETHMLKWLAPELEQKTGLCNHTNKLGYLRKSTKAP